METRTILHADLNNFYASVECMLNPELRSKPVAVCGRVEERHGIVLAKNYIAKAYGVKTGESVLEARFKCPDLVMVPPHYREYMKYSRLVREIYMDYTDLVEPYGMDENWLDVTGSTHLFGDGETIANTIRERVKFELGLTVSVGVSFNKIFAKLGSDMKKPDAVTCITPENFCNKIWGLPAEEMLGVGRSASRELKRFGIHTIGQLAQADERLLSLRFGINGLRMKQFANGEDTSKVMPSDYHFPVKSVGNGTTFLTDLHTEAEVKPMILALADNVAARLRSAHKKARGIALMVRCNDLSWREWQEKLDHPSQNAGELAGHAFAVFQQNYPWVKPLRAMAVRAIRLEDEDVTEQLSIFRDGECLRKMESVDRTVDEIRSRFGQYAIRSAATMRLDKLAKTDEEIELTMPSGMLTLA
ncbi:MAG: DNA polymerase IV [Clostridia bacterium]|nr:DNA polymerase IV [Clostridia bacterium]